MRLLVHVENGHIIDPDDGWVLLEGVTGDAVSDEDIIRAAERDGRVFSIAAGWSKVYDNWMRQQAEEEN
jgi:hypothetical protein